MIYRIILLISLFGLIAVAGFSQKKASPNIIIIMADDMGWGDASCYPQQRDRDGVSLTTPNIDRMARNGVQCMSGYSTGQVCSPSRAGLLSGRYQQSFGYYGFPETMVGIPKNIPTISEHLKLKGYATALFGKEHASRNVEDGPLVRGFDRFFGFLGGEHDYFDARTGEAIMALSNERDAYLWDQDKQVKDSIIPYLTDQITGRSVAFIREMSDKRQPFFLYVPYSAPHPPLQAKWEKLKEFYPHFNQKGFTVRDLARAMILSMDDGIGEILDVLKEKGIEENTLLFFTSDNGGHDDGPEGALLTHNGGLRSRKGFFWEGGIRVPYIVQWKGTLPAGTRYDRPVSHLDITATALKAAGVNDALLDGVNLLPFFSGKIKTDPHEAMYWGMEEAELKWAVRKGDWKLICEQPHPGDITDPSKRVTALYNLGSDRGESDNLINKYPEKMQELIALKEAFYKKAKPTIATGKIMSEWKAERERRLKLNGGRQRERLDGYPEIWEHQKNKLYNHQ